LEISSSPYHVPWVRIPQHKDKVHNHIECGKAFLTEEYFPEGRRDQFILRGKKVSICVFFCAG